MISGSVQVLDAKEPDPECTPFREQQYKLEWELEFGDNGGNLYTATGKDWVGLDLPMGSDDPDC